MFTIFSLVIPHIFRLLSSAQAQDCSPKTFFGLEPWYQYLHVVSVTEPNGGGQHCDIQNFNVLDSNSSFLLIGLAVVDDLLRIAGMVAVGYIIYGGILYVMSQGSPDQTGKAQATVINALIGLVIASLSIAIVTFVGNRIG